MDMSQLRLYAPKLIIGFANIDASYQILQLRYNRNTDMQSFVYYYWTNIARQLEIVN